MHFRNGTPMEVRLERESTKTDYLGRFTCNQCGRLVPRGSDRPFCLDHSEYAQALMRRIAAMEAKKSPKKLRKAA